MKAYGRFLGIFIVVAMAIIPLLGCEGDTGPAGRSGTSVGTVSGTVTNEATGTPLADVDVTTDPAIQGVSITTDGSGNYSASLPTGNYTLTFTKANFQALTQPTTALAGQTTTVDAALTPTSGVIVDAGANVNSQPDGTVNLSSTIEVLDGSSILSTVWTQTASVPVTILNGTTTTPTVVLPNVDAYRTELFEVIAEPPITPAQLPPGVDAPETFPEGLQNRSGVQALNPFQLEEAGLVTIEVVVETTSGTFTDEVEIHAALPWHVNGGTRTAPLNKAVLLHGKDMGDSSFTWTLSVPVGSVAALDNTTAQNPYFTPDVEGLYTAMVTNSGALSNTIDIFAGTWVGVIDNGLTLNSLESGDGRPVADPGCIICHTEGGLAPDEFTPWRQSGHAEIFTDNFNTSTHYSTDCFPCHTVGFNTDAANDAIDDQPDYQTFLNLFTSNGRNFNANVDNWKNMLISTPDSAQRANIQCENCHGPQDTFNPFAIGNAHGTGEEFEKNPRINLSSENCGQCHGEPLRHARFQQWQVSPHANYELAIDEGTSSGGCPRCHTANGFIRWAESDFTVTPTVTWTSDEVHPQTCPTCHSPHLPGTRSGEPTDATVRVIGTTPPLLAGFTAVGVGRGAVCMMCHNTRRGLRNETALPIFDEGRGPHGGAQTDVILGENAYFVEVGQRSPHSFLPDTCATCHMEQTPPPDILAYNLGGTNHTFRASITICANCHVNIEGEDIQDAVMTELTNLTVELEAAITDILNAHLQTGDVILEGTATIPAGTTVTASNFVDTRGRQAVDIAAGATVWPTIQLRDIERDGGATEIFGPEDTTTGFEESQVALKAGWNLLLLSNDKSKGVHNPRYVFTILGNTRNVLAGEDFSTITPLP